MESFPVQARKLLAQNPHLENNDSPTRVWSGFPLSHWDLQAVHPEIIHIKDNDDDSDNGSETDEEEVEITTEQLVDLD